MDVDDFLNIFLHLYTYGSVRAPIIFKIFLRPYMYRGGKIRLLLVVLFQENSNVHVQESHKVVHRLQLM